MKLGRIIAPSADGGQTRLVAVLPEKELVVDLARAEALRLMSKGATASAAKRLASAIFPESMSQAIALGDEFLETAAAVVASRADDAASAIGSVRWTSAIDPPVLRDCIAFTEHMYNYYKKIGHEMNPNHFKQPGYYKGSASSVYGHEEEIPWPHYSESLDYELEIGFVVGKGGTNLTPDQARRHLFGITIFNDWSARDYQRTEMLLGMGATKCKDFANGLGPWITTLDEFPRLDNLKMEAKVNGEVWATTTSQGMLWSPEELAAYISMGDRLQPGDVFGSGTAAKGSGLELDRALRPGDLVELTIEGVGTLRNRLGQPQAPGWRPTPRKMPE